MRALRECSRKRSGCSDATGGEPRVEGRDDVAGALADKAKAVEEGLVARGDDAAKSSAVPFDVLGGAVDADVRSRSRAGMEDGRNVLSTARMTPASFAIVATASRSVSRSVGFDGVSTVSLVLGRIASRIAAGLVVSTNVHAMPRSARSVRKRRTVPP